MRPRADYFRFAARPSDGWPEVSSSAFRVGIPPYRGVEFMGSVIPGNEFMGLLDCLAPLVDSN